MRMDIHDLRLIACDLDGTLLLDGAQQLRHDTCGLIRRLQQKGILFFAASGRQYHNLQYLFAPIREEIGYLCENGGVSFYKGRKIHEYCMDPGLWRAVVREAQHHPKTEISLSGVYANWVCPREPGFYRYMRDEMHFNTFTVPDLLQVTEGCTKVSLYGGAAGDLEEAFWKERFGDRCTVVASTNGWLDIMPKCVNKAFGLRYVLDDLHIDPAQCMAIGDNDNDAEILQLAGHPVAMQSGKPRIRSLAELETDTVEHLFERMLET